MEKFRRIFIVPENIEIPQAVYFNREAGWKDEENNRKGFVNEFYLDVKRETIKKYGKDSLAFKTITKEIDIEYVSGNQFFRKYL